MSRRTDRLARSLQVHLAELINYHLNDPRVGGLVTVSAVELSADLGRAWVRVTALNATEAQLRTLVAGLQHASGRLRAMLGERLTMRVLPRLDFGIDEQAIRARRLLAEIDRVTRGTLKDPASGVGDGTPPDQGREQPEDSGQGPATENSTR